MEDATMADAWFTRLKESFARVAPRGEDLMGVMTDRAGEGWSPGLTEDWNPVLDLVNGSVTAY